jgi:hypothetical protein
VIFFTVVQQVNRGEEIKFFFVSLNFGESGQYKKKVFKKEWLIIAQPLLFEDCFFSKNGLQKGVVDYH